MSSVNVGVNTFFQRTRFIDPLSKLYIGLGTILGLNRLPIVLNKAKYTFTSLVVVYSIIILASLYIEINNHNEYRAVVINDTEFIFSIIGSLITWKRLERYYKELNKFDIEIGCRPKTTNQSIKNLIFMIVLSVLFPSFFCLTYVWGYFGRDNLDAYMIPVYLNHLIELCYYGHLLSLIDVRLRLINCFVAIELTNEQSTTWRNIDKLETFKANINKNADMKGIMDLYHIIIRTHDFFIEAIKWQLLVVIITTFMCCTSFCSDAAMVIISKENPLTDILWGVSMIAAEMLPLFSPCIFGDRIRGEVKHLRELLALRLYDNKHDKPGRSAARALLALTKARDLLFSLLRVFKVDIFLPFKFISLLITYLNIMLQFQKVIPSAN